METEVRCQNSFSRSISSIRTHGRRRKGPSPKPAKGSDEGGAKKHRAEWLGGS